MSTMGRPPRESWPLCKASNCEKEARAGKGFCRTHYMAARRGQLDWETGAPLRAPKRVASYGQRARCVSPDCGRRPFSNALCTLHYARWKKGEDVGTTPPEFNREKVIEQYSNHAACLLPGCGSRPVNRWMCSKHAQQRAAGLIDEQGNPLRPVAPTGRRPQQGLIRDGAGYPLMVAPEWYKGKTRDGRILAHRFILEQHLGRYLESHEVVHHKDGNRQNNALSNLELHTRKTHPPAHEHTTQSVEAGIEALRHNDPQAYEQLLSRITKKNP